MSTKALFVDLIYDELDNPVTTAVVGHEMYYVIDDNGFHRHVRAEEVDRQVLAFFLEQLEENKEIAVQQVLTMMGKDDLFTKAAVDAQLRNVDVDEILAQGFPDQARTMLGMLGFRVVINLHGEVVSIEQPTISDGDL